MSQLVKKIRTEAGDLPIDYNALANLPELTTMFSNPNLLINSDFRKPVNQRGQTTYVGQTTKIYTIDRWCLNTVSEGRTLDVLDGHIKFTNSSTETLGFFLQHFERRLAVDNYTITVNVKSVSGNVWVGNVLGESSQSVEWGHTKQFKLKQGINKFTLSGEFIGLYFLADFSSNVELYWVKLEQGTNSTPFVHRLDGEEWELCLRYYQTIYTRLLMCVYTVERADGTYYFQVPMRTTPRSITVNSATYFDPATAEFIAAGDTVANWGYITNKSALIRMDRNANDTFVIGQCRNALVDLSIDAEIY